MTFGIIISGKNQATKSRRFQPHYNHAFGEYVQTKEDYLSKMKKGNYVPYQEAPKQEKKKYTPSKWARDMVNQIHKDTDSRGNYQPSGKFIKELDKKGAFEGQKKLKKLPKDIKTTGGFF